VIAFRVSPRSRHVVYLADQDADEVFELHSTPLDGRQPGTKLSGALASGGDVQGFLIAAGSEDVVYLADQEVDQRVELYRVPITGGAPVKLNAPLAAGARVESARITPDGLRVLYRTQGSNGSYDLFSVPITGGAALQLDAAGQSPSRFEITPDSKQVLFTDGFGGSLAVTTVLGGPVTTLAKGVRGSFSLMPDGQRVLYLAFGAFQRDQLFVVPLAGGTPLQLTEHGGARVSGVIASPDSSWILYATEFGDANGPIYTVSSRGGPSTLVSADGDEMSPTAITPDSRRALFIAFGGTEAGVPALFCFEEGGAPQRLTDRDLTLVALTPDSATAVVRTSDVVQDHSELLAVSLADGTATPLSPPLVSGGTVLQALLSPDGTRVVYRAEQDLDGVVELYSVPVSGGPALKLNGPLTQGGIEGDVRTAQVSPDGRFIVYAADEDTDEVLELYSAPAAGGPPLRISGPLVLNGDVSELPLGFVISPDSARVVYLADAREDGRVELFSVPIEGGPAVALNAPTAFGIAGFEISADSSRVVFSSRFDAAFHAELYSTPIEGGPAVLLSALADLEGVTSWHVTPDATRVAFAARRAGDGVEAELYVVPIGGGTPLRITPTPVAGGGVSSLAVLADSSAVVYAGTLAVADRTDLWWTPLAGGPTELLSDGLDPDQDVGLFQPSPDAQHAVYRIDRAGQPSQLWSVALPSGAPTMLSPLLSAGGVVGGFEISPDSSRVVYRADLAVRNDLELYSVAIAGGTPTRLNGPLVRNGDVAAFALSPDSSRVVYGADQRIDNVLELFSAPLTGGPATRLSATFPSGGNLARFAIDATSTAVVYDADQRVNDRQEIFLVPIDGSAAPLALNPPLPAHADVAAAPSPFLPPSFTLAGRLLLFHADIAHDETFELYRTRLPLLGPGRARAR